MKKFKKILSLCLVVHMLLAIAFVHISAITPQSFEENDNTITEEFVTTEFDQICDVTELPSISPYSTTHRTTYRINWTVKAGTTSTGSTEMYMYVGDTITFDLTYTPATNSNVRIGLLTPTNAYRYYTRTNGNLTSTTMEINRPGVHKFRVTNNSTFDITITGTYTVSITPPEATTWFSQKSSGVGTTWNSTYLSSLYCPNMSTVGCNDCSNGIICANIPWYTISDQSGHINKWGCSACSLGMIFRNLGATTTVARKDFRTGTTSNLSADPFTIAMANLNWPTITTNGNKYEITSHQESYSPVYPHWARIASSFGLNAYRIYINSTDPAEIADILAYYINENPEGILVRIADKHSLVFTDTTHTISATFNPEDYEVIHLTSLNEEYILKTELEQEQELMSRSLFAITSTDYDSKFTCFDPGTPESSKGYNVSYDDSWTAEYYGGIDLVTYICYFD